MIESIEQLKEFVSESRPTIKGTYTVPSDFIEQKFWDSLEQKSLEGYVIYFHYGCFLECVVI